MAHIEFTQDGHVLDIHVNRPEKYNALSPEMYHDLARAYGRLVEDPELRVAVLHAAGKHFTSGIELDKWAPILAGATGFPVGPGEIDPFGVSGGRRHRKPIVIAVQGYCYTWGVETLLNTEVHVAAANTQFAMLEERGRDEKRS